MNHKFLLLIVGGLMSFTLLCCKPKLDQPISVESIDATIEYLREDTAHAEGLSWYPLIDLRNIAKDQKYFKDSSAYSIYELVSEEEFDSLRHDLFNHFKKEKITYRTLLLELKKYRKLDKVATKSLSPLYEKIEKECQRRQALADQYDQILSNSLKAKVTKLQTANGTGSGNFVEFTVQYQNTSGKLIRGTETQIVFYDGFNKEVHRVRLTGSNPFRKSLTRYFTYYEDRPDDKAIYRKFENKGISSFTVKTWPKKINLDGEVIPPSWYSYNFQEKPRSTPLGYCPYLKDHEPLIKEKKKVLDRQEEKIKTELPAYHFFKKTFRKINGYQ